MQYHDIKLCRFLASVDKPALTQKNRIKVQHKLLWQTSHMTLPPYHIAQNSARIYPIVESISLQLKFSVSYAVSPPIITITNNSQVILDATELDTKRDINLQLSLPNDRVESYIFCIHRSNFDGANHQLLTLDQIHLDGINLDRICYHSRYYPVYPEPWISQQRAAGKDWPEYIKGSRSWGWNGRWTLEYQTPIYTWLLNNV